MNDWQGNLKVDALNPSELIDRIKQDTQNYLNDVSASIALTCLDQVIDSEKFISKDDSNNYHISSEENFINKLNKFNVVKYVVRGPKRSNVC